MSNATAAVAKAVIPTLRAVTQSSATLASETRFYSHAMIGLTTGGYLAKFDDTASMILQGVVPASQGNPLLPAGTAGDGTIDLEYERPAAFELAIASVAVTDIDKIVYATFDQTGTLDATATTYANVIGRVVKVVASGIALVEPAYDGTAGNRRLGASKRLAATGNQTLTKWDVGKFILCANTATLTVTLPASADVPLGGEIVIVKDHASDTNAITVSGAGSDSISGSATNTGMNAAYNSISVRRSGTNMWTAVYGQPVITS